MAQDRAARIRERLEQLHPDSVELVDQSHLHVGHAGAADGRGHFDLAIVASCFDGEALLARHRAVYDALGDMMQTDIHALSIVALTPDEALARH